MCGFFVGRMGGGGDIAKKSAIFLIILLLYKIFKTEHFYIFQEKIDKKYTSRNKERTN